MGLWTSDISTTVYNRVVNEFFKNSLTRYGMTAMKVGNYIVCLNFSTSQISESDEPKFPYVSIVEMPGQERGQTLEGDTLNGALFTFQVEAIDNVLGAKSRSSKIMGEIVTIMKKMRFEVNTTPYPSDTKKESRTIARFSRVIANNGIL